MTSVVLAVLVLSLAATLPGCAGERAGGPDILTPTSTVTPASPAVIPAGTAPQESATIVPSAAAPAQTATAPAAPVVRVIAHTNGEGVALRDGCANERRVAGAAGQGFREGTYVHEIELGSEDCAGWALVMAADERRGWVRIRYLTQPPWSPWPGEVASDSWGAVLLLLNAGSQSCIHARLVPSDLEAAFTYPLLAAAAPAWAPAFASCLAEHEAAWLSYTLDMSALQQLAGAPGADVSSCLRSFTIEMAAVDRGALFSGLERSASGAEWRGALLTACVEATLVAALDVVAAPGDGHERTLECVRESLAGSGLRPLAAASVTVLDRCRAP